MNSKVYKSCAVPQCKNTSIKTPNKVFVHVPQKKIIRHKWLTLARRNPYDVVVNSSLYFCEDHFDLPNDMENYMQYYLMGSVSTVRMKPGCIPTKFECQPERRKIASNTKELPNILRKQRKTSIEDVDAARIQPQINNCRIEIPPTSDNDMPESYENLNPLLHNEIDIKCEREESTVETFIENEEVIGYENEEVIDYENEQVIDNISETTQDAFVSNSTHEVTQGIDPVVSFLNCILPELNEMDFKQFNVFKRRVLSLIDEIKPD